MGRVKTQLIKRTTFEIYKKYGSSFTANFNDNKPLLAKYAQIYSKKLRNSIAGYMARLVKRKQEI